MRIPTATTPSEILSSQVSAMTSTFNLIRLHIGHKTYHHFIGQGESDSELDVLLYSDTEGVHENLLIIQCKLFRVDIDFHPDIILSTSSIPASESESYDKSKNVTAP